MIFRIFIGIIALLCAYMAYSTVSFVMLKSAVQKGYEGNVITSPQADMSVVEFFDYTCPSCREFQPALMRAVERDGAVRLVLRPIPSDMTDKGKTVARLALSAGKQGKFLEAHKHLIENYRVVDDAYIENFAAALNLDLAQLKEGMKDPEIDDEIDNNLVSLEKLGARGVPTLLLNGDVLYTPNEEGVTSDTILGLFNQARGL
ncbi:MAG TPA: thioredoxin domain-containing protein [Alphaproteobacteria bacterium]|nr:thioredoxin domain-containing protein [Alphaproteobacteria bacterium]USO05088.1 MAG: thioredoxin domain-containing protein [Rhodospirillales bacterium]HOO82273.1 thioredoxin domain-containing protein [Alphaproteobacteria bacterium]